MKNKIPQNIHFIGIGGIGASALAAILHKKGFKISGSDKVPSAITKKLEKSGIKFYKTHKVTNLKKETDIVVYSPAIPESNPELKKAKQLGITCMTYPQALGELTKEYFTIAIAGTHGKSTTTAIASLILKNGGLDPNVVIGTCLREFRNNNYRVGKSDILIIEACEYKRSFLNFHPDMLLVTNIEAEHLDYFKGLADYKKAFKDLANQTDEEGAVIIDSDDKNSKDITKDTKAQIVYLSEKVKKSNFHLKDGYLYFENKKIKITPGIPGDFNVKNAAMAATIGAILGVDKKVIEQTIKEYRGSWRRFEEKKKLGGARMIDDYAHHPTEIKATLKALRDQNPKARILVIYQPHQHNRTRHFMGEFGKSFKQADEIIIPNIYTVRDSKKDTSEVTTEKLVAEIAKHHPSAKDGGGLEKTAAYIKKNSRDYDLIVTMGAGDVDGVYGWL